MRKILLNRVYFLRLALIRRVITYSNMKKKTRANRKKLAEPRVASPLALIELIPIQVKLIRDHLEPIGTVVILNGIT